MKILIIDDDTTVCASLSLLLSKRGGYTTEAIHRPNIAIEMIGRFRPDLIMLDMNFTIDTSGRQGMRLLKDIKQQFPTISVILMTGWATVQLAVEGMKLGAKDFIAKPWDNKVLLDSIKSIATLHHEDSTSPAVSPELLDPNIIGQSNEMKDILDMVDRVAPTEASVLITGESGTGKELIAEAIHQKSNRKDNPFVKVNLGGISTELFESEMFGHLKGAFTGAYSDREGRFAKAHTGTIFLDEIGELAAGSQVKLLRVLQERTYERLGSSEPMRTDVRVISATNRNLGAMAIDGSFREDLYYRVNLINLHLPPLRDRPEDIPMLADYFLSKVSKVYNATAPYLSNETKRWLSEQGYKGNIRQLKNIVERTYLLHMQQDELRRKDFLLAFNHGESVEATRDSLNLQQLEINTIQKALAKHNHSISNTARALGITRSSLYRRLEKYGIPHEHRYDT